MEKLISWIDAFDWQHRLMENTGPWTNEMAAPAPNVHGGFFAEPTNLLLLGAFLLLAARAGRKGT